MAEFKDRLKILRTNEGLTQRGLAEKLNMSKSSISMYESGQRKPDFEALEALADHFNVDIDYLTGRKDTTHKIVEVRPDGHQEEYYENAIVARIADNMRNNPESRVVYDAMSNMTPEEMKVIAKLIRTHSD